MQLILMGTGTSHGIPVIGCKCKVCKSKSRKDKRYRCSAYVTNRSQNKVPDFIPTDVVIDTGPEFRLQALENKISRLDAVLLTHSHADHLHGLDDIRIFSHTHPHDCEHKDVVDEKPIPIYANLNTIEDVHYRFDYVFSSTKEGGGKPNILMKDDAEFTSENPLKINSLEIVPVPLLHGTLNDSGYILSVTSSYGKKHSAVYLTDCNSVPNSSIELIKKAAGSLEHLVVDGLRKKPHSTHFSFDEALACAEKIGAAHTWLTHICHTSSHKEIKAYIKGVLKNYEGLCSIVKNGGSVEPAYDGLVLEF